jgi:hypothetical protein
VRVTIAGREVQLTLRDHDEARLLARLQVVLAQFPVEAKPPPQAPPQAASRAQGLGEGWCHKHGLQMKLTTKDGRSWYSHRTQDGQWCKGKPGR